MLVGVLGVVGAVAAQSTSKGSAAELVARMDETGIDVGRIVVEQFEEQLTGSGLFLSVVPQEADAEFVLRIGLFGLASDSEPQAS